MCVLQQGRAPSKRGVSIHFGPDVTEAFLKKNNLCEHVTHIRTHSHTHTHIYRLQVGSAFHMGLSDPLRPIPAVISHSAN